MNQKMVNFQAIMRKLLIISCKTSKLFVTIFPMLAAVNTFTSYLDGVGDTVVPPAQFISFNLPSI